MPRYDYRCSVCGHEVELLHGIHDRGPQVCPNCGAEVSMRKAFATPAVHYKGSGWAKKDRSSSTRPAASSSSTDGSTDGSKDGPGSGHREAGESSDGGGNGRTQDGGTEGGAEVGADRGGDNATVTSSEDGKRTTGAGKAETGRRAATRRAHDRGAA